VRSFPWVHGVEEKFAGEDFRVVAIHSPEFSYEKKRETVVKTAREHDLDYPIYRDNDMMYWRSLNNRYWPSFYVVDKNGYLRLRMVGEMHAGTSRAERAESLIRDLLAES